MCYSLGHGKSTRSNQRFCRSRTPTAAGGAAAVPGGEPGRGGPPGGRASPVGEPLGARSGGPRPPGVGACFAPRSQASLDRRAPGADRAGAQTRSGRLRVCHRIVDGAAGAGLDRAPMRGQVFSPARLVVAAPVGLELPASGGTRARTGRGGHPSLEAPALAGAKKTPKDRAKPSSSSTKAD